MKRKLSLLFIIMLLGVAIIPGQKFNDAKSPQEVQAVLQELQDEIKKEGYSYTVGQNPALNYSIEQLCGLKEPVDWINKAKNQNIQTLKPQALKAETVGLPEKWDWREHNGVTPVKDQGSCGSCWAFGTVASFESLLLIKQDTLTDLSEQHLVSCNTSGWGCNGGWWAHDMFVNPGAVMEADFPYQASDISCGGPYTYAFQLAGWAYVDGDNKVPSTDMIKQAIYDYGPVSAAVYVGSSFQAYTGGVFDNDESSGGFLCCKTNSKVNHAIFLVGWDDSKSVWILKNSWGTGWGESGYMNIKYGINQVGYAAVVVY